MQTKSWCPHIYWNENESGCGFGGPPKTWVLRYPKKANGHGNVSLCELAKYCPICGAPRPKLCDHSWGMYPRARVCGKCGEMEIAKKPKTLAQKFVEEFKCKRYDMLTAEVCEQIAVDHFFGGQLEALADDLNEMTEGDLSKYFMRKVAQRAIDFLKRGGV